MSERVLICNRGEIAERLNRTFKKLGFYTVGICTNWDIDLPYTSKIDFCHFIPTDNPTEVFLNVNYLISLAKKFGCKYIHPGYGFLSENYVFAKACYDSGLIFIGPPPEAIRLLGSKINLKKIAKSLKVPILERLNLKSKKLKESFPIILKGSDTGGGRAMRIIHNEKDLNSLIESAEKELESFGTGKIFAEKYLENFKHIEIQAIVDSQNVITLLERDCSVQRKFQKVIEETPCPSISEKMRDSLMLSVKKIAQNVGLPSIYTYEFLVTEDNFYLSEVNTRLQVEHTITEEIYGIDLVEIQVKISMNENIKEDFQQKVEHSIQLRLYAENSHDYSPSVGYLKNLDFKFKPERLEITYQSGSFVSPFYDPLICKIIEKGSRTECIQKLESILQNLTVEGVKTNKELLLWVLKNHEFLKGSYNTNILQNFVLTSSDDKKTFEIYEEQNENTTTVEECSKILGVIAKINAVEEQVEKGDVVLFIESMKILNPIIAKKSGKLTLHVKEGEIVRPGQILFSIR